jgi:hypothetical protein
VGISLVRGGVDAHDFVVFGAVDIEFAVVAGVAELQRAATVDRGDDAVGLGVDYRELSGIAVENCGSNAVSEYSEYGEGSLRIFSRRRYNLCWRETLNDLARSVKRGRSTLLRGLPQSAACVVQYVGSYTMYAYPLVPRILK